MFIPIQMNKEPTGSLLAQPVQVSEELRRTEVSMLYGPKNVEEYMPSLKAVSSSLNGLQTIISSLKDIFLFNRGVVHSSCTQKLDISTATPPEMRSPT